MAAGGSIRRRYLYKERRENDYSTGITSIDKNYVQIAPKIPPGKKGANVDFA